MEKNALKKEQSTAHSDALTPSAILVKRYCGWISCQQFGASLRRQRQKKAKDCLALLRKSIGSLPVGLQLTMEKPIEMTLSGWVRSSDPAAGFAIQDDAELKALLEESGIVHCKKQDLSSNKIAVHIDRGR
nr:recombination-associated protein RdgC [Sodalis-like endosymbiont of Proechinophthirus fluctus]